MKTLFVWALIALISFLPITAVNANPNGVPANQPYENAYENLDQDEQITPPKAGISWREQVKKDRTNMRRSAEMRNANMRNAMMGEQEQIEGLSVDAYNGLIRERNAGLEK